MNEKESLYFWFKYDLDRSTTHHKFDPAVVRTHDPLIMNHEQYISCPWDADVLTTQPSATSAYYNKLTLNSVC